MKLSTEAMHTLWLTLALEKPWMLLVDRVMEFGRRIQARIGEDVSVVGYLDGRERFFYSNDPCLEGRYASMTPVFKRSGNGSDKAEADDKGAGDAKSYWQCIAEERLKSIEVLARDLTDTKEGLAAQSARVNEILSTLCNEKAALETQLFRAQEKCHAYEKGLNETNGLIGANMKLQQDNSALQFQNTNYQTVLETNEKAIAQLQCTIERQDKRVAELETELRKAKGNYSLVIHKRLQDQNLELCNDAIKHEKDAAHYQQVITYQNDRIAGLERALAGTKQFWNAASNISTELRNALKASETQ